MPPSYDFTAGIHTESQLEQKLGLFITSSADTQKSDISSATSSAGPISQSEVGFFSGLPETSAPEPTPINIEVKGEGSLGEQLTRLRLRTLGFQQAVYKAKTEVEKWEAIRSYERHHEKCLQVQKSFLVEHANKTMKGRRVAHDKVMAEWKAEYAANDTMHVAKEAVLQKQLAKADAEKMQLETKVKDMVCQLECQRQKAEVDIRQAGNIGQNMALKE